LEDFRTAFRHEIEYRVFHELRFLKKLDSP
jgi:hypothetical protein